MKQIMKKAWEIAREAAAKFGGKAAEYMSEALRMAWAEIRGTAKKVIDRIAELEALGFKRWQKNGMDRLYINATTLGLRYERYRTGNVRCAWFNGLDISNSECRRMLDAKTYIDVKLEKVFSSNDNCGRAAAELAGLEYAY